MKTLWLRLSNVGISSNMPIDASRKVILTNQLSYISFAIVFLMNLSFLFIRAIEFNPISFLTSFLILINPVLNKHGHHILSAVIFSTLMPIAILVFSSLSNAQMPPPLPLLVYVFPKLFLLSFLILPLILIDSRKKITLSIAIIINVCCIFMVEPINEWMGVGLDYNQISFDQYERINFFIIFPITVLLFGFISLNRINRKYEATIVGQNIKLQNAHDKIELINQNLTDSIQYAECIQRAILPDLKLLNLYFNDFFVYNKAKSIVSGDFYFVKELKVNANSCVAVAVADCTGHGVPGGFMSVLGISLLQEIVKEEKIENAAQILDELRFRIKLALNQNGEVGEQRDGMELAIVLYYPELKRMDFAGAKHSIYIASKKNELIQYKGDRMPIGIHHFETPFKSNVIDFNGGEMLYLFTDGIVDQMNKDGKKFLAKNLRLLLAEISSENCIKQEAIFTGKMAQWMKNKGKGLVEQIDDMLLMGLRLK